MVKPLMLAGTAFAFATALTAGAMASAHKAGDGGHRVGRFHAAATSRPNHIRRSSRLADVRAAEIWDGGGASPGYRGGVIDLGPLGMTAACGAYPQKYGYCGPRYGAPIAPALQLKPQS